MKQMGRWFVLQPSPAVVQESPLSPRIIYTIGEVRELEARIAYTKKLPKAELKMAAACKQKH